MCLGTKVVQCLDAVLLLQDGVGTEEYGVVEVALGGVCHVVVFVTVGCDDEHLVVCPCAGVDTVFVVCPSVGVIYVVVLQGVHDACHLECLCIERADGVLENDSADEVVG